VGNLEPGAALFMTSSLKLRAPSFRLLFGERVGDLEPQSALIMGSAKNLAFRSLP